MYPQKFKFFKEFLPMIGTSKSTYMRRKEEILQWLKEQYDFYFETQGKTTIIVIENFDKNKCKKVPKKTIPKEKKMEDYEEFIKKSIPTTGKLTSKAREARLAMAEFGMKKYGHFSEKSVAKIYTGPAMEKLCTEKDKKYWVDYKTYEPLSEELLKLWKEILKKNYIDEKIAAKAWYKEQQGEDTTKEKNAYRAAMEEFKDETGHAAPICVSEWELNNK